MNRPVLYVFAISHYCEKARWALDYLDIDYRLQYLAPGPHAQLARAHKLTDTSLPILVGGDYALQGSARIIDWAVEHGDGPERSLASSDHQASMNIEERLDRVFGVQVRRYYYSDALISQPRSMRPIFAHDLPWRQRLVLRLAWSKIVQLMIRGMDLGTEQGRESRQIVMDELDWLDGLLADGRRYLVGERLSRTDISAASLLSPLALPPAHPTYGGLQVPEAVGLDLANWQSRPSLQWTHEMYRRFRQ